MHTKKKMAGLAAICTGRQETFPELSLSMCSLKVGCVLSGGIGAATRFPAPPRSQRAKGLYRPILVVTCAPLPENLTCQWFCTEALARRRRLQRKISGRVKRGDVTTKDRTTKSYFGNKNPCLASSSTVIVRPDDGPVAREASAPTISDTNGPKQQNLQERLHTRSCRRRLASSAAAAPATLSTSWDEAAALMGT